MHLSKFLYSQSCNGLAKVNTDLSKNPILKWEISLPSNPSYGIETMAVWDKEGNIYLGCHNGTLYSLTSGGEIRFTFQTDYKIYSTPLILDDNVYFCSGDGFVYSITTKGKLRWKTQISNAKLIGKQKSILQKLAAKLLGKKIPKKSIGTIRTWASLNIDYTNRLFINTANSGLVVLNLEGKIVNNIKCKYKYPLAGVSFFDDNTFVVPDQKRFLYKYNSGFSLQWVIDLGQYDIWTNPVTHKNKVYVAATKSNSSLVNCYTSNGELLWTKSFRCELRGGLSVNNKGVIVPLFNGDLNLLDKYSGNIIFKINLHLGDRVLWTTAISDLNDNLYVAVRTSRTDGKITIISSDGKILHTIQTGKTLSPPAIDQQMNMFFGDWNGSYFKYKLFTNE